MATSNDQRWAAAAALIAIHQAEELVYPLQAWTRSPAGADTWVGRRIDASPIASLRFSTRAKVVAAQAAGLTAAWALTRRSDPATRVTTSALTLGWAAAFVMHITVSVTTRSAMPGLATSLVPGLPGAAIVLRRIWS